MASGTFTIPEVCECYGVTAKIVRAWIASGELRALNVSRATTSRKPRWRITQSALDAFEALRTQTLVQPRLAGRKKKPTGVVEFY
jgi:predicted site-specific integrase-resolvase